MTDRPDDQEERGTTSFHSMFEAKTVLFIVGITVLFITLGLLVQ